VNPFFEKDGVKLYHSDCISGLKEIAPGSADLVFADPPFNLKKEYEKGDEGWKDDDEYYQWCGRWISEAWTILRPGGTFWLMTIQKHLNVMWTELSKGGTYRKLIVWKNSSMPLKTNFCTAFQPILYFVKPPEDDCVFNYGFEKSKAPVKLTYGRVNESGSITDIWDDIPFISGGCIVSREAILIPGTKKKMHDCQMPIRLARRILGYTTEEDSLTVDLFCGSGTMLEAAWALDRACIGFEDKERHCKTIVSRMESAFGEDSIFDV